MTEALRAAINAASQFLPAEPVPAVTYRSGGRVLVIGADENALAAARVLTANLDVSVLLKNGAKPDDEMLHLYFGELLSIEGWLGQFDVRWRAGAEEMSARFDLILDLGQQPYFKMHQPPQGYFVPSNGTALNDVLAEMAEAVGEFEKPKFFLLDTKVCAHSRSRLDGCNRCLEICSTEAIRSNGDHVHVEPHLCMGCGACASVCPSGAMRYNYPSMPYWSSKLKVILAAYTEAGGKDACLLIHDEQQQLQLEGLPLRVIPIPVFHVASIGLDWLLGALALGACQVAVLRCGKEAPQYLRAIESQMELGEEIMQGLGYGAGHFALVDGVEALAGLKSAAVPSEAARFTWFDEKRTTLEFCIDHFVRHAPVQPDIVALSEGSPFGAVTVDGESCTLCYSCVAVCPSGALQDGAGRPQLDFIERNCVQCGLCEQACPENAISLMSRLLLSPQAKQKRMLHTDQPFHCVRCGKAFGTRSMVLGMTAKLAGHSMFSTPEALNRLKMCGDCRVIDMMAEA